MYAFKFGSGPHHPGNPRVRKSTLHKVDLVPFACEGGFARTSAQPQRSVMMFVVQS